ncbi:unnamed protein product [Macrosiphum euphorbiae]|uniref:Uncharacterized protein n=1 Tax=Macrosiphum euphorbiae TaxID=13131 RepID=A0AAV0W0C0_9HEMI|nr:unnamed protein product [Macrosiphum euphorbiae]CAI6345364.1 unnamed protein product [Macrosiphum euphorbiae]CAI6346407.1 unnamed protein product [Macrosiphum euphorbiae]CAI6346513.1 unnamed protein product [Macrosiphum euphorbiae]CAI6346947.1 unnamed protein product [Macrosiphum euphorbiae]
MAAHRLQRYAVFLSGYSYKIEFIKGIDNGNADALSRLPVSGTDSINDVVCDKFYINLITTNVKTIVDLDICMEVKKDVKKSIYELQVTETKEEQECPNPPTERKITLSTDYGTL